MLTLQQIGRIKCLRCLDYGFISHWNKGGQQRTPCSCEQGKRFRELMVKERMSEPKRSPTLDEYMAADANDSNAFWRLESGDHHNLLDEAIERLDALQRESDEDDALRLKLSTILRDIADAVYGEPHGMWGWATLAEDVKQKIAELEAECLGHRKIDTSRLYD